jgi:hypothetical protein
MGLPVEQVGLSVLACGTISCNNAGNNAVGTAISGAPQGRRVQFSGNAALTVAANGFGANNNGMYVPANTVVSIDINNVASLLFWGNAAVASVGYIVLG